MKKQVNSSCQVDRDRLDRCSGAQIDKTTGERSVKSHPLPQQCVSRHWRELFSCLRSDSEAAEVCEDSKVHQQQEPGWSGVYFQPRHTPPRVLSTVQDWKHVAVGKFWRGGGQRTIIQHVDTKAGRGEYRHSNGSLHTIATLLASAGEQDQVLKKTWGLSKLPQPAQGKLDLLGTSHTFWTAA